MIYILLAVVLRIYAIPIILILLALQRKYNPHGAAEGYCLSRTRKQLKNLPLGLLFILLSAAVGVAVYFGEDYETYKRLAGVVMGAGLLVFGVYLACTAVRDSLFPAKSRLAASIRSQLPYPEEAPEVGELFAMVDNDLKENAIWLGSVGIGREWVLGDAVSAISRIRGIFTEDKIRVRQRGGRTQSSRILQLILIDDRWQMAVTDFRDPQDLHAAADCLAMRVPDARRGGNDQYTNFMAMGEAERESFLREFQNRQNRRASEQARRETLEGAQNMILTLSDGSVTSRVTPALVERQLAQSLEKAEDVFFLTPGRPVQAQGQTFLELECASSTRNGSAQVQLLLKLAPERPGAAPDRTLRLVTDPGRARDILRRWLRLEVPDLSGWEL